MLFGQEVLVSNFREPIKPPAMSIVPQIALNAVIFDRHEYFYHPKNGKIREVPQENIHSHTGYVFHARYKKAAPKGG